MHACMYVCMCVCVHTSPQPDTHTQTPTTDLDTRKPVQQRAHTRLAVFPHIPAARSPTTRTHITYIHTHTSTYILARSFALNLAHSLALSRALSRALSPSLSLPHTHARTLALCKNLNCDSATVLPFCAIELNFRRSGIMLTMRSAGIGETSLFDTFFCRY